MNVVIFYIIILLHLILANSESEMKVPNISSSKKLSRRKRYIIFPEGSSFQLVYCLTMPTFGMGQIFTIGLTAALAWELPHEPIDLKKEKNTNTADKRVDKPTKVDIHRPVYQSVSDPMAGFSEAIKAISEYRKPWSTSKTESAAKATAANAWGTYTSPRYPYYVPSGIDARTRRTGMGSEGEQSANFETSDGDDEDNNNNWEHLPAYKSRYLYRKHGIVHRRTRRNLFAKIEKFFIAQNKDGIACLLKALCEVNQTNGVEKGTFIEEILRAIFTWIPEDENTDDPNGYNIAATHKGNCTEKYPTCTQSVWNPFF